jgi:hypothetical protein
MPSRRSTALWVLVVVAAGVSCDRPDSERKSGGGGVAVAKACSQCHVVPPPDVLPRGDWDKVIDDMARIAGETDGASLAVEELNAAKDYYAASSDDNLINTANRTAAGRPNEKTWSKTHYTPVGLEQELVPAVSHVDFVKLSDDPAERVSLMVSEMRSRAVFHLPLELAEQDRFLYPMLREANYPARTTVSDLDGNRSLDLLVAGMGSMIPSNATEGSVILALQRAGRSFEMMTIESDLGRPVSARPADLDGDGDTDLVVSAFGWRGPGGLEVLASRNTNDRPTFDRTTLDARDGFISIEIHDLDADGLPDIVALLAQEHEQVIVFRNEGGLQFSTHLVYAAPHPSWAFSHLLTEDIDGDDDLDLVTANGDSLDFNVDKPYSGVQWFENLGDLRFEARTVGKLYGCATAAAGDIDRDGDPDIVAASFMPLSTPEEWKDRDLASLVWFENRGPSSDWTRHVIEQHNACHATVAVGDANSDGWPDIAVGNYVWLDPKRGPLHRSPYVTLFTRNPHEKVD